MGRFRLDGILNTIRAKFVFLLCLIIVLSSVGITQMVFAFPKLFDNGLNPILYSPKKPDIPKISNYQIKKDGLLINVNGNTQLAKPFSKKIATTNINSRLNAFGSCVSLSVSGGVTTLIDNTFRLASSWQNSSSKYSLVMYPQIRDIIPPNAIINSVTLVTDIIDPNLPSSVQVNVNEITSMWDPRDFQVGNIPSISPITAASGVWDLTSADLAYRTLDITSLAGVWFSGSNQWGIAISTPIIEGVELDFSLSPCPRIYIDYDLPSGSYSGNIDGGTWYSDSVCPGLWLPKRATYFNKLGILQNNVKTRVFFDTSSEIPPFGLDNQSFRYVVGGNLYNNNNPNKTMELGVRTWSKASFDALGFPFHDIPVTQPPQVVGPPPTPMTLPQCEEEIDDDGTSYPYGEISNQIVDYSSSISYVDIPVNTGWGQIWIKKGRRIRTGPHGNLKSTVYKPFAKPEMYIINDPTIVELIPQTNVPQDGSYDTSLPQPEFEQSIDIGATGPREDKMEQYFSGSQANWGTQSYNINPLNAAFELNNNDFSIPCHGGLSLAFGRTFSSASQSANGILGPGWHTNIEQRVQYFSEGYLHYLCASGEEYVFTPRKDSAGNIISYDPPPMLDWKVEIFGSGDNMHVEITDKLGDKRLIFNTNGTISDIITKQGGAIHFSWNQGKVEYIEDAYSGRKLTFTYDASNRLVSVVGPDNNRNWTYEYDTQGDMIKATDPEGGAWRYEYNDKHNIDKIYDPRNNLAEVVYQNTSSVLPKAPQCMEQIKSSDSLSPEMITRNSTTRISTITEPTGEETEITYNILGIKEEIKDDNDASVKFDYNLDYPTDITRIFNQIGDLASGVKYDSNRNVIESYDAYSNKDEYTYWPNGKIHTFKDKEGHITTYTWNEDGSLPLTIEDPLQRVITYQYDTSSNLTKLISPYKIGNDAETQFQYDTNGYIKKVINAEGKQTNFEYNPYGELIKITDPIGNIISYVRNKLGHVTKVTGPSPTNYDTLLEYDACMNVTKYTNPRGYITQYEYNPKNQLKKITDANNISKEYFYDDSGKLLKVKDSYNKESSLEYDQCGRLLKTIDQNGKINQVVYDLAGRIVNFKGPDQDEVAVTYDKLGLVTKSVTKEGSESKYEYNKDGILKKTISPENNAINYQYDACYRITNITDPLNNVSSIEYWPSGNTKKITDSLNHKVEMDYDKIGALIQIKDNQDNISLINYDDNGNPIKLTNPLGKYITYEYNQYNLVKKFTNELGKSWTLSYDENMNTISQTTPLGKTTRWEYDNTDRVKKIKSPMNNTVEYTYDNVGNLISIADPLQHLNQLTYNNTYKVEKVIDALNNQTKYEYSDGGNVTKITSPKNTYQTFSYNMDNQLTGVTDPMGSTSNYSYNKDGALSERKNPKQGGLQTSFTYSYDACGRRISFTDEAGKTTSTTYNTIGLTTRIDHPNGKYITSSYDSLNRLSGSLFGDGTSFSYAYDVVSRITSWTDQHGSKTFSYDDASRMTSTTDTFGDSTSFVYDDDNRLTSYTDPLGQTSILYDDDSRPTQISLPGGDAIQNTYDTASRITNIDLPIDVDINFQFDNANKTTLKSYDTDIYYRFFMVDLNKPINERMFNQLMNRVRYQISQLNGNKLYKPKRTTTTLYSFGYSYDANSNVSTRTYPDGTHTYTYDNYDRLTQITAPEGTYTYTYDVRSNRVSERFVNTQNTVDNTTSYNYTIDDKVSVAVTINNFNQQIIHTVQYSYDDAGNTISKAITEGGTTLTTSYTYYDDNRIKSITLPDEVVWHYTYHADGSRATKYNSDVWIKYQYSSGALSKETHCLASNHSTILKTVYYQPHRYTIDPDSPGGGDQVTYYIVSDSQGTPYKLLNTSGVTVAEYTYAPFGERLTNSNPAIYNPIGYSGTYLDGESGLYFAQSRYYDSRIGRFTTKDVYRGELEFPISQNRYIYCEQNPATYTDPTGFAPVESEPSNTSTNSTHEIPVKLEKNDNKSQKQAISAPTPQKTCGGSPPPADTIPLPGSGKGDVTVPQDFNGWSQVQRTSPDGSTTVTVWQGPNGESTFVGWVSIEGKTYAVTDSSPLHGGDGKIGITDGKPGDDPIEKGFNRATSNPAVNAMVKGKTNKETIENVEAIISAASKIKPRFASITKKKYANDADMLESLFYHTTVGFAIGKAMSQEWPDVAATLNQLMINRLVGLGLRGLGPRFWEDLCVSGSDLLIYIGFAVSYTNELNGWGLPFNVTSSNSKDTALSLVAFAKFIVCQLICESANGDKVSSWVPWRGPGRSSNAMGVKYEGVKAVNDSYNLDFALHGTFEFFGTVSIFESVFVGTLYMGMCLNAVSHLWKGPTIFTLEDLGAAAWLYNPTPDNSYPNERMVAAFGPNWSDYAIGNPIFEGNLRYNKVPSGYWQQVGESGKNPSLNLRTLRPWKRKLLAKGGA
jgi:RHS repeat-associated protein